MHNRWALGWLTGPIVVLAIVGFGCGGDDAGGGGGAPPPLVGTATMMGTVVAADDTQTAIPNASIIIQGANRQANSQADGSFVMQNLPTGTWGVQVQTPDSEVYGTASAQVPLNANQTTRVTFAVLPLEIAVPEQILLDPTDVTVDLNGRVGYRTRLVGPDNLALDDLQPTWVVTGEIGTVSPTGVFTAQTVGAGQVTAYAGNAERAGTVIVVAPRPPQITSFQLTPQTLPATGGDVFISAAVTDGDGILLQGVTVRIFAPGNNIIDLNTQVINPATAIGCGGQANCYLDASFGVTFAVPANDNQPSPDGVQAVENYSARLQVTDRSGMTSQSPFIDFVVQGIDQPPPRPAL